MVPVENWIPWFEQYDVPQQMHNLYIQFWCFDGEPTVQLF